MSRSSNNDRLKTALARRMVQEGWNKAIPPTSTMLSLLTELVVRDGVQRIEHELKMLQARPIASEHQLDVGREASGDAQIDADARISLTEEGGFWIEAWVWVDYDTCPQCDENHAPDVACNEDALRTAQRDREESE